MLSYTSLSMSTGKLLYATIKTKMEDQTTAFIRYFTYCLETLDFQTWSMVFRRLDFDPKEVSTLKNSSS